MAVSISVPVRPRPQQTAQVLNVMASNDLGSVRGIVVRAKGAFLRNLLDAAQDVAEGSEWSELRALAQGILEAARIAHPDYFDPTLKGV